MACLALAGAWVLTGFSNAPAKHASSSKFQAGKKFTLEEGYSHLPLAFEPNQGQTDSRVKYLARGAGYTLFLTNQGMVLALKRPNPGLDSWRHPPIKPKGAPRARPFKLSPYAQDILRLSFTGASSQASFEGQDSLSGVSNYFIGQQPSQWHTRVPHYGRVRVREIYPGVDMAYYGDSEGGNRLEYDLQVKPGTDPGVVRIKYEGAESAQVDGAGNLQLSIAGKTVSFRAPLLYQEIGGSRKTVEGGYRPTGGNEVGFEVKGYDKTKPLVIDPILDYSTYIGGAATDNAYHIKVDAGGNAYVVGATSSVNYPTTAGAFQTTDNAVGTGGPNAFVTKLNPTGTALVYSTYIGGTSFDVGIDIDLDGAGDAFITGYAASTDFPTTAGAFQSTENASGSGGRNAFVAELNPAGSALVYSTYLGGTLDSLADAIAVDGTGSAYVTGYTSAADFPTTGGAFQTVNNSPGGGSYYNAFVTKVNPGGSTLSYSTYLGGSYSDYGLDVVVQGGDAFVTGYAFSTNFPTLGPYQGANTAAAVTGSNNFVTQLTASGTALVYSTYVGGSGNGAAFSGDQSWAIAVDPAGDAYITGNTDSANYPTTAGAYQLANNSAGGGNNAFITELNPAGNGLVYSTYLGGGANDYGQDIALDPGNCAYVMGYTTSANFPTTSGAYQSVNNSAGGPNVFLTEVNSAGASLYYSSYLGGSANDLGYGVALDTTGAVYVCGYTSSANFPTTTGVFQSVNNSAGSQNDFVAKFDVTDFLTPTPTPTPTPTVSPTPTPPPDTLSLSLNLLSQASGPVSIHEIVAEYPGHYSLRVYNSAGELVKVLDDNTNTQSLSSGALDTWVTWDGTNTHGDKVASGIYVIELTGPFHTMIGRIAVVK